MARKINPDDLMKRLKEQMLEDPSLLQEYVAVNQIADVFERHKLSWQQTLNVFVATINGDALHRACLDADLDHINTEMIEAMLADFLNVLLSNITDATQDNNIAYSILMQVINSGKDIS